MKKTIIYNKVGVSLIFLILDLLLSKFQKGIDAIWFWLYNCDKEKFMELSSIFTEMSWISGSLLCLGLLFVIVEVFMPGFGFFGITGMCSLIAGIVVRICEGLSLEQSLILILIVLGALAVGGLFMIFSAQYGFLGRTGLFENQTTISKDYNKLDKEHKKLIGKSGKAVSNLNLGGQAKINGKIYEVQSISSFIPEGSHVKVVSIKDNTIMVRKWFE